jgi:hypothetical protein
MERKKFSREEILQCGEGSAHKSSGPVLALAAR